MATAALPLASPAERPLNRGVITAGVMIAMFMQVLDATIANVALPHMQSSLGATRETVTWVLTSYIVASAAAIPITGWLADRIGRKRLFLLAVLAFTVASVLCAAAQTLPEMVLFRILQGVSGAFIGPLCQAVLFDINPPERHARAMAVFGAGVMIGPIMGPVLGGWLTEHLNWRWVFLVNLPFGLLALLMLWRTLPRTPMRPRPFDYTGFLLFALAIGVFQLMLDRGEGKGWFESWEIIVEAGVAAAALWMFTIHMVGARAPLFDRALFRDRNLVMGIVFMFVLGGLMMSGPALLPPLLQGLLGYPVFDSGLLTSARGVGALATMLLAGRLISWVDARLLVTIGLLLMSFSMWQMTGFSLDMDARPVIVSGVVQGLGMGLLFVPFNTISFGTIGPQHRTSAASLLNLSRSLGGSVGISVATTILTRNLGVNHAELAERVTSYNLPFGDPLLLQRFGETGAGALAALEGEVTRQALMIAYLSDFYLMMYLPLAALPLLLLVKRPKVGEK